MARSSDRDQSGSLLPPGASGPATGSEGRTPTTTKTGRTTGNGAKESAGAPGGGEPDGPTGRRAGRGSGLRTRILPRSVLGVACLILAFAVGAGFSGVVLFSYYQYKLNQTNDRVNTLVSGYKNQFANAEGNLAAAVAAAKANIQGQLKALQQLQAGPATLAALIKTVAPSVYFVHTLDASGQAAVGTAFVVSSTATQSLLLTSYTTVKAATVTPGPTVYVRQNNTDTPATVRSWDPQYDLALLVLPEGGLRALRAATLSPASATRRPDLRSVWPGIGGSIDLAGHRDRRLGEWSDRGCGDRPGVPGRTADQPGRQRDRGGIANVRPVRVYFRWGLVRALCRGRVQ